VPDLFIITGSNGAGKSTVGSSYLPENIQQNYSVFDGDKLFMLKQRELFPATTRSHKEAKRLAYDWLVELFESLVDAALAANDSFVYEGHFTNDATWDVPKRFKDNGYKINLIFFGLANPALSELRVVERSKSGGHYVSPIEVESNFFGNLDKLNQYYSIIDDLTIVDTSETGHIVLLHMVNGSVESSVPYNELPEWFIERLPSIAEKIKLTG
jgi:predicted ABC-type ATPase